MYEFEQEMKHFYKMFQNFQKYKIALYGIGRKTATLVAQNTVFDFVGLLDRNPENVGKEIYGLPILSLEQAQNQADLIIINTPENYWEVIYQRIENSKIPVYFLNGHKAILQKSKTNVNLQYWQKSMKDLKDKIQTCEIIISEVLNVIYSRRVLRDEDVYKILNLQLHQKGILDKNHDLIDMRTQIQQKLHQEDFSIYDVYEAIGEQYQLTNETVNLIIQAEIELEKSLSAPRNTIIDLLREAVQNKKEIYFVTDSYFPKSLLKEMLEGVGILINSDAINVLSENQIAESYFQKTGQKMLYIGSKHFFADNTERYEVMSVTNMLKESSLRDLYDAVTDETESLIAGTVVAKMFENPFALNEEKGNVIFKSCRDWGYAAFGGLLYTYLLWQDQKLDEYGIEKLLFLSRDGYLLKQIYDYWVGKNTGKKKPESDYLYASRRMAYVSTLKDEQSYREWMEFPYTGLFKDYLKIRFSVELENDELALEYVELPRDKEKVDGWLRHYQNQIRKNVEKEQQDYYEYVMKHLPEKKCAVMDMGYYGMIQCRLQELSGKELFGFYFSNYLADDNEFARKTKLIPCFQQEDNISGVGLNNRKYSQLLESIFTAPYGMVIAVDEDGNRICSNSGKNQNSFILREEIKEGIQDYLDDMIKFNDIVKLDLNNICIWADKFMGLIIGNSKTCDQIRKSFYFEEEIVKKDENTILT